MPDTPNAQNFSAFSITETFFITEIPVTEEMEISDTAGNENLFLNGRKKKLPVRFDTEIVDKRLKIFSADQSASLSHSTELIEQHS